MKLRQHHWLSLLIFSSMLVGCASGPKPKKEPKQKKQPETKKKEKPESLLELVDRQPAKSIDGRLTDWKDGDFRSFKDAKFIVRGEKFRDNPEDLAFEVAVESDSGYLYLAVKVQDETVVDAGSERPITDGVVITLRDPVLESLADRVQPDYRRMLDIFPETSIIFTPDGQFYAYGNTGSINRAALRAEPRKTKNGYILEAAFAVETLQQVYQLPLEEIAFRIDIFDGDSPDKKGTQTRMSIFKKQTLADTRHERRFMLYDPNILFPHDYVDGTKKQLKKVGRWRNKDGKWQFQSLEASKPNWKRIKNTSQTLGDIEWHKSLEEICPQATSHGQPVAWQRSTSNKNRAQGLFVCVRNTQKQKICQLQNPAYLIWVQAEKNKKGWAVKTANPLSEKPVRNLCLKDSIPDKRHLYLHSLKTVPLQHLGTPVWAVYARRKAPDGSIERIVRFVEPNRSPAQVGKELIYGEYHENGTQDIVDSKLFLTGVDKKPTRDICIVERRSERRCTDGSCQTLSDTTQLTTRIRVWNPEKRTFEKLMLSKHENCTTNFKFSERQGYQLLPWQKDLAIISSPQNE
jgi:hypothetical protein